MQVSLRRCGPLPVLALLLVSEAAPVAISAEFTSELWDAAKPVYAKTLQHPFLSGLTDGTLPKAKFRFYLLQDSAYLRAFSQALSLLAARAPDPEWAATLNQHAVDTLKVERQLHETILVSYGITAKEAASAAMAPSNHAYANHLLAAAALRPFGEGLAAVLPCYWIYWEVGKHLAEKGSRNPDYQRWIEQYSGEEYGKVVRQVLAMMNREAQRMTPESRSSAVHLFVASARYEWMFWDMAWREEAWKP